MKVFLWNGIFGVAFILAFNPVCAAHWVYQDSERSPSQKNGIDHHEWLWREQIRLQSPVCILEGTGDGCLHSRSFASAVTRV